MPSRALWKCPRGRLGRAAAGRQHGGSAIWKHPRGRCGNTPEGILMETPLRAFREGGGRMVVQSGNALKGVVETLLRALLKCP
ncbi:hypothetical protein R1flu_021066 [Riccia fluitans]|uniref:Uncharacterized protein n=1 Tax=Riccia fluitans TaxID=41844 RepID=A0ABD1ZNI1_9MARC